MGLRKIIRLYQSGNVSLDGLRGTGKDLLTGNVIARRGRPYISNMNYIDTSKCVYVPLNLKKLDVPNDYHDFLNNDLKKMDYDYPKRCDIYISDAGVYLPSQYCNQLNKEYPGLIAFQQLSRQVAECNIHFNTQNLNRVWDKVREQSDIYIKCNWCKVFFGKIVIQKVTLYEKYQSCLDNVKPCRIHVPLFAKKEVKMQAKLYLDNFRNTHGLIKPMFLIYINKSKHNTLLFGDLLVKKETIKYEKK